MSFWIFKTKKEKEKTKKEFRKKANRKTMRRTEPEKERRMTMSSRAVN